MLWRRRASRSGKKASGFRANSFSWPTTFPQLIKSCFLLGIQVWIAFTTISSQVWLYFPMVSVSLDPTSGTFDQDKDSLLSNPSWNSNGFRHSNITYNSNYWGPGFLNFSCRRWSAFKCLRICSHILPIDLDFDIFVCWTGFRLWLLDFSICWTTCCKCSPFTLREAILVLVFSQPPP